MDNGSCGAIAQEPRSDAQSGLTAPLWRLEQLLAGFSTPAPGSKPYRYCSPGASERGRQCPLFPSVPNRGTAQHLRGRARCFVELLVTSSPSHGDCLSVATRLASLVPHRRGAFLASTDDASAGPAIDLAKKHGLDSSLVSSAARAAGGDSEAARSSGEPGGCERELACRAAELLSAASPSGAGADVVWVYAAAEGTGSGGALGSADRFFCEFRLASASAVRRACTRGHR